MDKCFLTWGKTQFPLFCHVIKQAKEAALTNRLRKIGHFLHKWKRREQIL